MKLLYLLVLFFSFNSLLLNAQEQQIKPAAFEKNIFESNNGSLPYAILFPKNYDPAKAYPLLLFLHGAGERGNDNELQLLHGANLFTAEGFRNKYPAIIVFPQCEKEDYWSNVKRETSTGSGPNFSFYRKGKPTKSMLLIEDLLAALLKKHLVDKSRLYVGGLSMGGMGTFEIVKRNPRLFAAAFPICGGAKPTGFRRYKKPAWWIFHGLADPVVPPVYATDMAIGLEKIGAKIKYSLYEGVGHNSWDNAFAEPTLFPWLFAQSK